MRSSKRPPPPKKKPYRPPVVRVYGNVAQITRAVGKTGAADGKGSKKTRP